MELHFVGMANVFACCRYSKEARFARGHYVHGSAAPTGVGISIVQLKSPSHLDAVSLEKLIRRCWAKVECGCGRILVRDNANSGWISYMLKDGQKSEFEGLLDCVILESLYNPSVDA